MAKARSPVLPSPALKRKLQLAVVLVLLALVPIRVLASVTTGFCEVAHGHGGAAVHDVPGHDAHDPDGKHPHGSTSCASCLVHCSGAAFATSFPALTVVAAESAERYRLPVRAFGGFIPDHLDPPPLAA